MSMISSNRCTKAQWLDGKSAEVKKVILCVATPKVILRTEEDQQDRYAKDLYQCAIEDVRLQPRIGQAPRSILFPDGSLCLVEDHQMVERLFPTKSRQGESMHQLES
ncbi:DUF7092 domain-containing protein, partial [Magnetococcales bacterium HHB-1]